MTQKLIIFLLGTYLNVINRISKRIGGKHAFLLFCYPFPIKLKPAQKEFIHTSEQSFFEYNGKRIAVFKWGSVSETILCLHGWQSQTYRWKKFVEELDKEKYTIVSIDAPAHGLSEGKIANVPMYADLLEHLMNAYTPQYILAHSLGAFSSLCLFYEKPELSPRKMALLGTPGEAIDFVDEYAKVLGTSKRVYDNLHEYFVTHFGKTPEYYSSAKFAEKQTAEGLLIHDVDDKDAPYHYAQKINEVWPNSTLHTTTGLGHKLRDLSVVRQVVDFFDE